MLLRRHKQKEPSVESQAEEQGQDQASTALTNKELKAMLDAKGIEYDKKANKETLLKLLEGAE